MGLFPQRATRPILSSAFINPGWDCSNNQSLYGSKPSNVSHRCTESTPGGSVSRSGTYEDPQILQGEQRKWVEATTAPLLQSDPWDNKMQSLHIQFLLFLMGLSWKHWFSTKNEVKTKRWRKCKPEDAPKFFLSVCHCFGAKAASVPPSPRVLFCSTNNWGTRRRKYLLCPFWESMRLNQWHSFLPPINLFHPFLHPQNTFLSWFPNDLKYTKRHLLN